MAKPVLTDDPYVTKKTRWFDWHSWLIPKLQEIIDWVDSLRTEFRQTEAGLEAKRSDEPDTDYTEILKNQDIKIDGGYL